MPKNPDPPENFDSQLFPSGEQLFQSVTSRDPDFWDIYAIQKEEPALGTGMSGHMNDRTITGKSESGAQIQVKDADVEVYHTPPQPGIYSISAEEANRQLVMYKRGISISVTPPHELGESSTTVELFVPDDAAAHSDLEPPHAVSYSETGGAPFKIVPIGDAVPEDAGKFDAGVAEIKYYLGDNVLWDSPQDMEIPPPPTASSLGV
jgi:hypothetical protein